MANKAAWLVEKQARPFVVKQANMPVPADDQVVIKIKAVAINPVDATIQNAGIIVEKYPAIIGCDMAGEVHAVGSKVRHVKVGDRVLASADSDPDTGFGMGTFQYYGLTNHKLVAKIPDSTSFTDASVLPLAMATAATGLFDKRCMGLSLPDTNAKSTGETLLVWGAASSVGSCAVQAAVAGGYDVITTSSKKNFDYCKSLGAKETFDYSSETIVDDVLAYLKDKKSAGVFCAVMPPDSLVASANIANGANGYKHVGTVLPDGFPLPANRPADVKMSFNYGTWLKGNEVGDAVFVEWIPKALANGTLKCKPDGKVVGKGLESIQAACDAWSAGVSAQKIVVEI